MSANNHPTRKSPRFTPLRRKAAAEGIPYTSARDAHFRNELSVLKLGANDKHQRWYVEDTDWENWVASRKQKSA